MSQPTNKEPKVNLILKRLGKENLEDLSEFLNERLEKNRGLLERSTRDNFEVNKGRVEELKIILKEIKNILR